MVPESTNIPLISTRALDFIEDGFAVGLGSGKAAAAFVQALGQRVQSGLRVRGVPTSEATAELATRLGIPLVTLDDAFPIDVTVDGADEVDPHLNLLKGWGGALVRERIVAAASRRLVILVGPLNAREKLVPALGTRGSLPVEILPFAHGLCRHRIQELGLNPGIRQKAGRPLVTDNGNWILDCQTGPIADPANLDLRLREIPGVAGTGLFLGMAHTVLIQDGDTVTARHRQP